MWGVFISGIMFRAGICLMAGRLLDRFAFIWRRRNVFAFTCFSLIPYSYPRSDILFLIDKPQLVNRSKTRISYRQSY